MDDLYELFVFRNMTLVIARVALSGRTHLSIYIHEQHKSTLLRV